MAHTEAKLWEDAGNPRAESIELDDETALDIIHCCQEY